MYLYHVNSDWYRTNTVPLSSGQGRRSVVHCVPASHITPVFSAIILPSCHNFQQTTVQSPINCEIPRHVWLISCSLGAASGRPPATDDGGPV